MGVVKVRPVDHTIRLVEYAIGKTDDDGDRPLKARADESDDREAQEPDGADPR